MRGLRFGDFNSLRMAKMFDEFLEMWSTRTILLLGMSESW